MITIDHVNRLDRDDFIATFADIAEHSPWVAARAAEHRPFADRAAFINAFQQGVRIADEAEQLTLLRAHPDLAGRAARAGHLTSDSEREQRGAGLDTLSDDEFERFHTLNEAYKSRFGIPFIYAVKGATKHDILQAFETRLGATQCEEFMTALTQVLRIIRFRLTDRVMD
jgi:2-oxo-4-hydroxy-4-carboxy-5-ureidoimidazoline decarboxylase